LILIATSARADTERQAQAKAAAVAQMRSSAVFRGLSRASVLASLHPMHANNDALIERVQAMGVRLGRDVFIRQSSMERNSDLDRLSEIRCPTLIIAAHDDGLRSLEEARELQLGIHDAEVVVIEDSGHMLPMEAPEAVGAAITSWLARHPPAST
jgi:pimeloyl-ACP methyl ester carboxylesterase